MFKNLKYLVVVIALVLISGCSSTNNHLESINYNDYKELIENKESFVLEVMQDGCSYCKAIEPKLESFTDEYDVDIKVINLTKLSDEDYEEFTNTIGTSATPVIIFYKNGEEKSMATRILGNVSEDKIVDKFKDNEIIK